MAETSKTKVCQVSRIVLRKASDISPFHFRDTSAKAKTSAFHLFTLKKKRKHSFDFVNAEHCIVRTAEQDEADLWSDGFTKETADCNYCNYLSQHKKMDPSTHFCSSNPGSLPFLCTLFLRKGIFQIFNTYSLVNEEKSKIIFKMFTFDLITYYVTKVHRVYT